MGTRVLIWGIGKAFWNIYNILKLNERVGNIEIVGYVSQESDLFYIDGKKIFLPNEIIKNEIIFQYIIVATNIHYNEICDYGSKVLHIERKRFINGNVFLIPYFEWNRYIDIYNNNVSIVTETCLGGVLSSNLGLPFCSPFVNTRIGIRKNDFFKLLENLDLYMEKSPAEVPKELERNYNWNGWEGRVDFPKLWYDDILIHGFHYNSQREFFNVWEKRRKRYNADNKIVLKILYDDEDVEIFENLKYPKKVGFSLSKTEYEDIVTFNGDFSVERYSYQYATYIFETIKNGEIFKKIDIFRLLNGEKNWNKTLG